MSCSKCGYNSCSCSCEDCGCKGQELSCHCVEFEGDTLPQTAIVAGDTLCEMMEKVDNAILALQQELEELGEGLVEVERAAGVPSSTPTGTAPIIYVNETTGDLYTWDGTNEVWVLRGGVTINTDPDTFAAGTAGAEISATPVSSSEVTLKTIYTNSAWATFSAANAFIDVTHFGTNAPQYRLRWDTRMEFAGAFRIDENVLGAPGTGGLRTDTRAITLSTLGASFRPAKFKRFTSFIALVHTTAADTVYFPGYLDFNSSTGAVTFTSYGCGTKDDGSDCAVDWNTFVEVEKDNIYGTVWITDAHYFTQA